MQFPLVSIIIPVKDRFEWFFECLNSAINQTYRPIEIIIVDDGSKIPVSLSFPNCNDRNIDRIVILRNETSMGPGAAREQGRTTALGEYICYLDSDDVIHPDKLLAQVQILSKSPAAGMCYCKAVVFSKLPISGNEKLWYEADSPSGLTNIETVLVRPWGTSSCMWSKRASDLIGPWSTLWIGEDKEYEFRAGCLDIEIKFIDKILCYYRRSDSLTHLSSDSEWRNLQYSRFVLSITQTASTYKSSLSYEIKLDFIRKLLFSSQYLLRHNQKVMALKSLNKIEELLDVDQFNRVNYTRLLVLGVQILPCHFAYLLIKRLHYRIIYWSRKLVSI